MMNARQCREAYRATVHLARCVAVRQDAAGWLGGDVDGQVGSRRRRRLLHEIGPGQGGKR